MDSEIRAYRSRRALLPTGLRAATVLVKGENILAVEPYQWTGTVEVEDWGNAVIGPGVVDCHVHLNEPGRTDWEGFATGTRAAVAGGITTLVDMPLNSSPVTTGRAAWDAKVAATQGKLSTDCGFYGGLVHGNAGQIPELLQAGALGIKAFLCDSGLDEFSAATLQDLEEAMPVLADFGAPLLVHAELVSPHTAGPGPWRAYGQYLQSRPPQWELEAVALVLELCRKTRCRVHIVHLGTYLALPVLERAKEEGLPVTVETCPHYLTFAAEEIGDGQTLYKCAPPVRDGANQAGLWRGLETGVIDFVASDHSPCPPEMKKMDTGDFSGAWGGIAGLQWTLPAIWTGMRARGVQLDRLASWCSAGPAGFLGLEGQGRLEPGALANMVIWDPEREFEVTPDMTQHRHKSSPYGGRRLFGVVLATLLRGNPVYALGREILEPSGRVSLGKWAI